MGPTPITFQDRIWQNLDKLILTFLFLICLGVAVWLHLTKNMDEGSLDWVRHNTDLVLAGLLGLMGGRALGALQAHLDNSKKDPDPGVADGPH